MNLLLRYNKFKIATCSICTYNKFVMNCYSECIPVNTSASKTILLHRSYPILQKHDGNLNLTFNQRINSKVILILLLKDQYITFKCAQIVVSEWSCFHNHVERR